MLATKEMVDSDENSRDSKYPKLVPDLGTIFSLEDVNIVKPGKITIKGYAVSGGGRKIEKLEISLDRWKSCVGVSKIQKPVDKSARVSFEATIDVSHTTEVNVKEIKVRALVINQPLVSSSSERQMRVPDMIRLVLERLNIVEFHIARSISSDWYNTKELSIRKTPTPWLILFPNNDSCKLVDPCENKHYMVRDFGVYFPRSRCLANSGSWFLMLDHRINFHLLNVFTREKIRLPSLGSIDGCQMEFQIIGEYDFLVSFYFKDTGNFVSSRCAEIKIGSAVLWLDERSRDYFVVWNIDSFFAYYKNGDSHKSWKVFQPRKNPGCIDMVFKENKLYVLSQSRNISVFHFSGSNDSPKEIASFPSPDFGNKQHFNNLALAYGHILIIESRVKPLETCYFKVYKLDRKSSKWIPIQSLGNKALFLDLGTTIAAKDGVKRNCIYFSNDQVHRCNATRLCDETGVCIYNIQTKVVKRPRHLAASSSTSMHFKDARWFFPTFGGK